MSADVRVRLSFTVYGTEFVRILRAVSLFQARPQDFEEFAAVRCLSRDEGLSLAATNGSSAAAGQVQTSRQDGVGPFSLGHSQVKAILAVFDRKLPKGTSSDEYVLEVTVTETWIRIEDASVLFDGDVLTVAVVPEEMRDPKAETDAELVMRAFNVLGGTEADPAERIDLEDGIYFSPVEVGRIARAVKALGLELHLRQDGRRLVAPTDVDFIAFTVGSLRQETESRKPPWIDERADRAWRRRLIDIAGGVV